MERAHISGEYSRLVDCGEMFERLELGDVVYYPGRFDGVEWTRD